MAIRQSEIQAYSSTAVRKSIEMATRENKPTAFLSHSHKDANLAKGVQGFLQGQGWEVYIDWEDAAMPEQPSRETAERIQGKIRSLDMFIFLATVHSSASRWCPWEIGFADGVKKLDKIIVLQTRDSGGVIFGNEYMQLYRHIDYLPSGGVGSLDAFGRGHRLHGSMRTV